MTDPAYPPLRIRPTRDSDAERLPAIERSAGERFRDLPELAWLADGEDWSVDWHRERIAKGACCVAVDGEDQPIGFLAAEIVGCALYICELAVRLDLQGAGLGGALIAEAVAEARRRGLDAVTLTTFRDVAWNQAFYAKLGFTTLEGDGIGEWLGAQLRAQAEAGLPRERRCAMRLDLSA
jgi:ribosomal protein S18 acetylase RimI-like enzyme